MSNNLATNKPKFSAMIQSDTYQKLINGTLGDPKKAQRFVASISSAVAVNPALQDCEAGSILSGALLGESLNLTPSPQLGQFYLVPFTSKGTKKAQFILGYKGYIQLAIRSGYYKKLNVIEIKQGELKKFDALSETIEYESIEDCNERDSAETIGYYAFFEYTNGFTKAIYWSKEKMLSHADNYSNAFSASAYKKLLNNEIPEKDLWKYSSHWYKNFDDMAKKTLLRQLISKWGIMSVDLQTAFESDSNIIQTDENNNFVANQPKEEIEVEQDVEFSEVIEQVDLNELD